MLDWVGLGLCAYAQRKKHNEANGKNRFQLHVMLRKSARFAWSAHAVGLIWSGAWRAGHVPEMNENSGLSQPSDPAGIYDQSMSAGNLSSVAEIVEHSLGRQRCGKDALRLIDLWQYWPITSSQSSAAILRTGRNRVKRPADH